MESEIQNPLELSTRETKKETVSFIKSFCLFGAEIPIKRHQMMFLRSPSKHRSDKISCKIVTKNRVVFRPCQRRYRKRNINRESNTTEFPNQKIKQNVVVVHCVPTSVSAPQQTKIKMVRSRNKK